MIWIQVRDVRAERARLAAAGVPVTREPATELWGLTEMWIEDPDGIRIVLVEVPPTHPLRRDPRSALPPTRNGDWLRSAHIPWADHPHTLISQINNLTHWQETLDSSWTIEVWGNLSAYRMLLWVSEHEFPW
jgi:hypothetical protein